jgi:hypothetical protein
LQDIVFTCCENRPGNGKTNIEEVEDDEINYQAVDILVPGALISVSLLAVIDKYEALLQQAVWLHLCDINNPTTPKIYR